MGHSATRFFEHADAESSFSRVRVDVQSLAFRKLRAALRKILHQLRDDGLEDDERFRALRGILLEWLTTPVGFDSTLVTALESVCDPDDLDAQWGADLAPCFREAIGCAKAMVGMESPLRTTLDQVLRDEAARSADFRIYCHRNSIAHFQTLPCAAEVGLDERDRFICTLAAYREHPPFSTLVKVGPLRAKGWGRIPDCAISAPRQRKFISICWSGCNDDPEFGLEPATAVSKFSFVPFDWTEKHELREEPPQSDVSLPPEVDDLQIFTASDPQETRLVRSVLAVLPNDSGILLADRGELLAYDPEERVATTIIAGEELDAGHFLVFPDLGDGSTSSTSTAVSSYGKIWKQALADRYHDDPMSLLGELRAQGLRLRSLRAAVERWLRPVHTVIPAPKTAPHFRLLLRALGLENRTDGKVEFWRAAWREVERSRGAAIKAGVQEQAQMNEGARNAINTMRTSLDALLDRSDFEVAIPRQFKIRGVLRFVRVLAVEAGFQAPDEELRRIDDLDEFAKWQE
jgi:hypothetical protein